MKTLKNLFSYLYVFIIWIILSTMVWNWVFNLATDTSAANKVTVYIESGGVESTGLAVALEKKLVPPLKMVKVHPFSYAMMGSSDLLNADIFIVKESNIEQYKNSFAALESVSGGLSVVSGKFPGDIYYIDGIASGIKVYDGAARSGAALDYVAYDPGEDCYLFFGNGSAHLEDGIALKAALEISELNGGTK